MTIFPDPKWSEQRMSNFGGVFWFAATWDFCLQKNVPKDGETWERGGWFQMGHRWVQHKEPPIYSKVGHEPIVLHGVITGQTP